LVEKECVGIDHFDLIGVDTGGWEVANVEGHNGGGVGSNRGGEHVAIFWMTGHPIDEGAVTGDFGLGERPTHLADQLVHRRRKDAYLDKIAVQFLDDVG
jgi:hypothetical protein